MTIKYKWSNRNGLQVKEPCHDKPTIKEVQEAIDNNGILKREKNTLFVKNYKDGWDSDHLLVQKSIWNGIGSNVYVDCYQIVKA